MNTSIRQNLLELSKEIPSKFEVIQWLDTRSTETSSAYVNTLLNKLDGRTSKIELDACWKKNRNSGDWFVLFGAQATDNDSGTIIVRVESNSGVSSGHPLLCSNLNDKATIQISNGIPFSLTLAGDKFRIGDTEVVTACGSTPALAPLYIGAAKSCLKEDDIWFNFRRWQGLVGRCTVYDNGKIVGDFIPVKRLSDSICGYYDVVTHKFMQSNGEVPFTEGVL